VVDLDSHADRDVARLAIGEDGALRRELETADQEGRRDHRHPGIADGGGGMAGVGHGLVAVGEAGGKLSHGRES
jgi:hypothetical protein